MPGSLPLALRGARRPHSTSVPASCSEHPAGGSVWFTRASHSVRGTPGPGRRSVGFHRTNPQASAEERCGAPQDQDGNVTRGRHPWAFARGSGLDRCPLPRGSRQGDPSSPGLSVPQSTCKTRPARVFTAWCNEASSCAFFFFSFLMKSYHLNSVFLHDLLVLNHIRYLLRSKLRWLHDC